MEKIIKIIFLISIVLITICTIIFSINSYKKAHVDLGIEKQENMKATKKAVVVKVNENYLSVMGFENENDLYSVSFAKEGNIGFKEGQEILIHYDGMVATIFPGSISNVGKIEIIGESDTNIPDNILRYYNNSRNNVVASISEFTNRGMKLTIVDKNELPYEYSSNYKIYKEVENKDYTGVGQKIGEDTENSVSGYTRNRKQIYMGRSTKDFRHK